MLGKIPHPRRTVPRITLPSQILRRHELPRLQTAPDKINIPRLVEDISPPPLAAQHDPATAELLKGSLDVTQGVVPAAVRDYAGLLEGVVGVERAK